MGMSTVISYWDSFKHTFVGFFEDEFGIGMNAFNSAS
jgi:hypothetical protein